LRSNTLFGFADLLVPELHLRIREATVHESRGKRWIGLPAKPQVTREGHVRRDDRGKTAYAPVLEFTDKPPRDAFSARAIEALVAAFPDAFDDGGRA
jgi:hypothetical protein